MQLRESDKNTVTPLGVERSPAADRRVVDAEIRRPLRLCDAVITRNDPDGHRIRRYVERFEQRALASGVRLELSDDFDLLAAINPRLDKLPLTPQFDPALSAVGPVNAFWLKGVDAKGEVVVTQAMRYDDLSDTTLAIHLRSLEAFYSDPASSAHADESCMVAAPVAHAITGKVCYQGELWIKPNAGFRGHDVAYCVTRLAMAIAHARWSPDFIYASVGNAIGEKGIAARYGYRNMTPNGTYWVRPQTGETLDEWLIWMTWRDLSDMIEREMAV